LATSSSVQISVASVAITFVSRRRRRLRARLNPARFLVTRQDVFGAFPRTQEVKRAEVLASFTGS
jgi:hypothetical protein